MENKNTSINILDIGSGYGRLAYRIFESKQNVEVQRSG